MKVVIKWAKSRLSMKHKTSLFRDIVNGKMVHEFVDSEGVRWMAHGKWGFRTRIKAYKKYERQSRR